MGGVRWSLFVVGLFCFLAVGIGLCSLFLTSAPGGERTIPEDPVPIPDKETANLAEVLQAECDANGPAVWPVAEVLAEACRVAYLPPYEAVSEFEDLGFKFVDVIADGSMMGYVVTLADNVIVVFRGTDDPGDWIANLNRFVAMTPDGPAHRGFYTAYQPLAPQVVELVRKRGVEHIWITGHSLGGALAVLCAYDLAENEGIAVRGLITFGQPMVARPPLTERIEQLLSSKYVHYANGRDIVPRLPPSFAHCGSLVYYNGDTIERSKLKGMMAASSGDQEALSDVPGVELEPLTDDEFADLQRDVRQERAEPDVTEDGIPIAKGNSPLFRDHDMNLYLDRVRRGTRETD
jgi:triacylglycerol lipase